jgi:hypothetical protein
MIRVTKSNAVAMLSPEMITCNSLEQDSVSLETEVKRFPTA